MINDAKRYNSLALTVFMVCCGIESVRAETKITMPVAQVEHTTIQKEASVKASAPSIPQQVTSSAEKKPASFDRIQHVVIIYAENRSFDHLYGFFPGAEGLQALETSKASLSAATQTDRDGSVLSDLPPVWRSGVVPVEADTNYPLRLSNQPFSLEAPPVNHPLDVPTRDLVHNFYEHQAQINGGKMDRFAAISDAGALTMGHYNGASLSLYKLARNYTLADHFFMGAFGGSFLNHFWLVCACTPVFPEAPQDRRALLDEQGMLRYAANSPRSALEGPPQFMRTGPVTPDGYAISTIQPPYQPSAIEPELGHPESVKHDAFFLPPQTMPTIGDRLSAKGISWAWYADGWSQALNDRDQIYHHTSPTSIRFQAHHQPFNYFSRFAPGTDDRKTFLKDGSAFKEAIQQGTLPAVSFFKPGGRVNHHPGYSDLASGDRYIADIVERLQKSPQWKAMAIIITYDENGGFWDHVAPPKADRWGPGSRVPTIIISPFAKKGFVDHTQYDTTSILHFLTHRFGLEPLPGARAGMGDFSAAFE
jgi:acid phosphatase